MNEINKYTHLTLVALLLSFVGCTPLNDPTIIEAQQGIVLAQNQ